MTDNDMTGNAHAEWVAIGTFASGLEADMAKQALEAEDIPVLVRSNAPGIFGAAFQGGVPGGITLHVPSPVVDHAREVLDGDISMDMDADDELTP